jgi:hypothetical protein
MNYKKFSGRKFVIPFCVMGQYFKFTDTKKLHEKLSAGTFPFSQYLLAIPLLNTLT